MTEDIIEQSILTGYMNLYMKGAPSMQGIK